MIPSSLSTKDRLRRTKSARSVRKSRPPSVPPDPFDPELAKRQATTAASLAMTRSSKRPSTDSRRSYDRLGGPGSVGVPQGRRRSGSIQFTDDNASVSHASVANGPAESSVGNSEHYQSPSAALPPITEFGGLDGRNSSQPSSYRRLRKAKSMFSTRYRPAHSSYGMSSPRDGTDDGMSEAPLPQRTLRRSMSFLRGGHPSKSIRHAKSQDASIQLARAQFLQNAEEYGAQEKQAALQVPKLRRDHKRFRKTFRTTSAPGLDAAGVPSWSGESRVPRLHGRARNISHSIKNRIKRALGLSRPPEEPSPVQASPVPSQYGHDDQLGEPVFDPEYMPDDNHRYSIGLEGGGLSRAPTVMRNRSSESLATSKSRVTSWADSTINTIAMRKAADGNSLSIIDEYDNINRMPQQTPNSLRYGPSQGSPQSTKSRAARQGRSVDSQRLYSALMKRIGRGNIHTPEEGVAYGAVKEHRLVPERTSSAYSRRSRNTVRQVASNESMISPRSFATALDTSTPTRQSQYRSRQLPAIILEQSHDGKPDDFRESNPYDAGHVDDSSSGIVPGAGDLEYELYSPSVYSRTTNTPVKEVANAGFEPEEPGMVTILSSQRAAYNSPKRNPSTRSPGVPIQPSADWQKWMSSEIEKIESPKTIRGQYKRDAEMFDGDDFRSLLHSIGGGKQGRQPASQENSDLWTTAKIPPQSSFSRPFSRSSSARTIVPQQRTASSTATQPPSVFPTPDPATDSGSEAFSIPNPFENKTGLSPMRSRSSNMQGPESPTPKRGGGEQRRIANEQYRRYQTRRIPIPQDGKAQTRPIRGPRDQRKITNENIRNEEGRVDMVDHNRLGDIHSTISSKRMVEMFLNSRRRQADSEYSDSSVGAFL